MNQVSATRAPVGLVASFLILLVIFGETFHQNQARALPAIMSTYNRKPPFNGSIFGKRSSLPPIINSNRPTNQMPNAPMAGTGQVEMAASLNNHRIGNGEPLPPSTPVESLASLMLEQEQLIKAAMNQCSYLGQTTNRQGSDREPFIGILCEELFEQLDQSNTEQQYPQMNKKWYYQVLSQPDRAGFT